MNPETHTVRLTRPARSIHRVAARIARLSRRCVLPRICKHLVGDEDGVALLFFALSFGAIAGFAALAFDGSYLYAEQNRLQATADSAALAGASQLPNAAQARALALEYVEKNMPNAKHGVVSSDANVEVGNWDTTARAFVSDTGPFNAIRVSTLKSQANGNPVGMFFARLLGFNNVDVGTQATAGQSGQPVCLLALDPTGQHAIRLDSNAQINLNGCSVQVNSTDDEAIETNSNSSVTADSICVAGGYDGAPSSYTPTPETGCPQIADPLANVPPPPYDDDVCDFTNTVLGGNGSYTLGPGVYCGGITASSNPTIVLDPGVYVIKNGPFHLDSNATMTGSGVGIYLTGAGAVIDFNSNSQVQLSAPTAGPMAGLVFYEDRNSPAGQTHQMDSNTNQQYEGTLYFPKGTLEFDSNTAGASQVAFTAIIAFRLRFDSNANLSLNGDFDASNVPVQCAISGRCVALLK